MLLQNLECISSSKQEAQEAAQSSGKAGHIYKGTSSVSQMEVNYDSS